MFNLQTFFISLFLLFSFNAHSILHISLSPEETTCEELGEYVEGMKLSNAFGAQYKILKVKNTNEMDRTIERLVCYGDAKLSDGSSGTYKMELYQEDGEIWYSVSPNLEFISNNSKSDKETSDNEQDNEARIIHKGNKEILFEYTFWLNEGTVELSEEIDPFTEEKIIRNAYASCDGGIKIHYLGSEDFYFNSFQDVSLQPIYSNPTIDTNYQYFLPKKEVMQPDTKLVLDLTPTMFIDYIEEPNKIQIEQLQEKQIYQCDVKNIETMGFYRNKGPTFTLRESGEVDGRDFWDHAIIKLYSE